MDRRKIIVKQTAADNIAAIAWYIESKGLIATADKFAEVYMIILLQLLIKEDHILFAENLNGHF